MNDCECQAHYMQNCEWWCGLNLTSEEIALRNNPQLEIYKQVKRIADLLEEQNK